MDESPPHNHDDDTEETALLRRNYKFYVSGLGKHAWLAFTFLVSLFVVLHLSTFMLLQAALATLPILDNGAWFWPMSGTCEQLNQTEGGICWQTGAESSCDGIFSCASKMCQLVTRAPTLVGLLLSPPSSCDDDFDAALKRLLQDSHGHLVVIVLVLAGLALILVSFGFFAFADRESVRASALLLFLIGKAAVLVAYAIDYLFCATDRYVSLDAYPLYLVVAERVERALLTTAAVAETCFIAVKLAAMVTPLAGAPGDRGAPPNRQPDVDLVRSSKDEAVPRTSLPVEPAPPKQQEEEPESLD